MQSIPRADCALMLAYHGVSVTWPAPLSVSPAALEAQVGWLHRRGYRGVTFSDAVDGDHDERLVAITFDDAHRSVVSAALPILSAHGMVGTVFVPTAHVRADIEAPSLWPEVRHWLESPHADELTPASWDELRSLRDGGWEIAAHSHTHARLPDLSDAELARELSLSREICERETGEPCRSLAYPYGAYDDRVIAAAEACGYRAAAGLPRRSLRGGSLYALPRIGVYRADDLRRFKLKVNPAIRRFRASWAFGVGSWLSSRIR